MDHAERVKIFVALSASGRDTVDFPSRMEIPKTLAHVMNWNVQTSNYHMNFQLSQSLNVSVVSSCLGHILTPDLSLHLHTFMTSDISL
jgi:hypothetical protein